MNLKSLLDRPIAFHRQFVKLAGCATSALFLSQLLYWSSKCEDTDGWFYKTAQEWEEETGLTRREQETARKALKAAGVIEEKLKGVPARVHYRANEARIIELLGFSPVPLEPAEPDPASLAETCKLDCTKTPTLLGGNEQTSLAENANLIHRTKTTAETTAKTTPQEGGVSGEQSALVLEVDAPATPAPATPKSNFSAAFVAFWEAYPRKNGKGDAWKAWGQVKAGQDAENVMAGLERAKRTRQWMRDGGQYIPFPATWLRRSGWLDEDFQQPAGGGVAEGSEGAGGW